MTLAFRLIFVVGLGLALWFSLMPVRSLPPSLPSDPVTHAAGWAALTFLMSLAHRKLSNLSLITLLALGNLATEVLQGVGQSGRSADVSDWTWGMVGILIVAGLRAIVPSKRSANRDGDDAEGPNVRCS